MGYSCLQWPNTRYERYKRRSVDDRRCKYGSWERIAEELVDEAGEGHCELCGTAGVLVESVYAVRACYRGASVSSIKCEWNDRCVWDSEVHR